MSYSAIIAKIDEELSNLREVRKLLAQSGKLGSTTQLLAATKAAKKTSKRTLSPEARARIAAAQKKRWAAIKKANKK
ncbi:MAG TPA: hypothetical protein VGG85_01780 [Terracidiphilus sp.]|jgi:molybdopterin-biosynthesis enzyme MoeA-like protein